MTTYIVNQWTRRRQVSDVRPSPPQKTQKAAHGEEYVTTKTSDKE